MKNKIILFDIDHTLFDTNLFRQLVAGKLQEKLPEMNLQQIEEADRTTHLRIKNDGKFSPKKFADLFSEEVNHKVSSDRIVHIWTDKEIFQKCLYPDVLPVLKTLQSKGYDLAIFSTGVIEFQMAKIATLENFFENERIHIFELKDEKLSDIIKMYNDKSIIFIDDSLHILRKAKSIDKDIFAVWIKRDTTTAAQYIEGFHPEKEIESLEALPEIISSI